MLSLGAKKPIGTAVSDCGNDTKLSLLSSFMQTLPHGMRQKQKQSLIAQVDDV